MEARVVSRAIMKGQHFAEITLLLDNGELSTFLGPARKNRPEALKDCLELRKVAAKCTDDLKLLQLKKRKVELEDTTWTVKLGLRGSDCVLLERVVCMIIHCLWVFWS